MSFQSKGCNDLTFSIGVMRLDKEGVLRSVEWDSPAFKAGLTAGNDGPRGQRRPL